MQRLFLGNTLLTVLRLYFPNRLEAARLADGREADREGMLKAPFNLTKKRIGALLAIGTVAFSGAATGFDPFCRTTGHYQSDAVIEFEGEQYASSVVRKSRSPRNWTTSLNSSGCRAPIGAAFVFKTDRNEALLVHNHLCWKARRILKETGTVDIREICSDPDAENFYKYASGYYFPNAENPTTWAPFWFNHFPDTAGDQRSLVDVKLISWSIRKSKKPSTDDLERLAPKLLHTVFGGATSWHANPEQALPYYRRRPFLRTHEPISSERIEME